MNLTQEDWVSQFADENAVILDVRTEDEFNEGFIATPSYDIHRGAGFVNEIEALDKSKN
jgi:rhodanese-related sulfurtransferase